MKLDDHNGSDITIKGQHNEDSISDYKDFASTSCRASNVIEVASISDVFRVDRQRLLRSVYWPAFRRRKRGPQFFKLRGWRLQCVWVIISETMYTISLRNANYVLINEYSEETPLFHHFRLLYCNCYVRFDFSNCCSCFNYYYRCSCCLIHCFHVHFELLLMSLLILFATSTSVLLILSATPSMPKSFANCSPFGKRSLLILRWNSIL